MQLLVFAIGDLLDMRMEFLFPHCSDNPESFYRQLYYECIDSIISCIQDKDLISLDMYIKMEVADTYECSSWKGLQKLV